MNPCRSDFRRALPRTLVLATGLAVSACTEEAPVGTRMSAIPPGQEQVLAAIVGRGVTLPGPCSLADAEIDHTVVRSTYKCPGGDVILELRHPDRGADATLRTAQFAIAVVKGARPPGFLEALEARTRAYEAGFTWKRWSTRPQRPPVAFQARTIVGWVIASALAAAVVAIGMRRRRTIARAARRILGRHRCAQYGERLRHNPVIRHGPVTALLILIAVCVTSFAVVLRTPEGLLTAVPLGSVIALYFRRIRAGTKSSCTASSSPSRS
jgi:hypothetical protein